MKSLYLRVWLTLVALLALFALASGVLFQRQVERERGRVDVVASERTAAWAELIQRSLPSADAPREEQATALREWAQRLALPMALDDAGGQRIAASDAFERRMGERERSRETGRDPERNRADAIRAMARAVPVRLADGRTLWVMRPGRMPGGPLAAGAPGGPMGPDASAARAGPHGASGVNGPRVGTGGGSSPPSANTMWGAATRWWPWPQGVGLAALLGLLFVGVAAGAYPVVRRLTRRLESLKQGVEQFGAGALNRRVSDEGRDEVAAVARSFNQAAERIETLVKSNQSLLANASHELRSPLARMKMAVSMLDDGLPEAHRNKLKAEIHANITELDALVDEVLLASRLDALQQLERRERVDLHALVLEEAARVAAPVSVGPNDDSGRSTVGKTASVDDLVVQGDERLLRRAARNLLENAHRYGGGSVDVSLARKGDQVTLQVFDRGPGVPDVLRERIFEPFFRLPGHAEKAGGVGLGLSLVRQIANRHGGRVHCDAREGGGSVFVLGLPAAQA